MKRIRHVLPSHSLVFSELKWMVHSVRLQNWYIDNMLLFASDGELELPPGPPYLKIFGTSLRNVTDSRARLKSGSGKVHLRRLDLIWVCRNINQLQWFANLLVTIQNDMATLNPDFFHVMIYLTRTEDKEQVPHALRSSTTFGRPNWDGVISAVRRELEAGGYAEGVGTVGVFLCGSAALGKDLAKTCRLYSHGKYSFPFKKEHF
jgi:hypothetical protein